MNNFIFNFSPRASSNSVTTNEQVEETKESHLVEGTSSNRIPAGSSDQPEDASEIGFVNDEKVVKPKRKYNRRYVAIPLENVPKRARRASSEVITYNVHTSLYSTLCCLPTVAAFPNQFHIADNIFRPPKKSMKRGRPRNKPDGVPHLTARGQIRVPINYSGSGLIQAFRRPRGRPRKYDSIPPQSSQSSTSYIPPPPSPQVKVSRPSHSRKFDIDDDNDEDYEDIDTTSSDSDSPPPKVNQETAQAEGVSRKRVASLNASAKLSVLLEQDSPSSSRSQTPSCDCDSPEMWRKQVEFNEPMGSSSRVGERFLPQLLSVDCGDMHGHAMGYAYDLASSEAARNTQAISSWLEEQRLAAGGGPLCMVDENVRAIHNAINEVNTNLPYGEPSNLNPHDANNFTISTGQSGMMETLQQQQPAAMIENTWVAAPLEYATTHVEYIPSHINYTTPQINCTTVPLSYQHSYSTPQITYATEQLGEYAQADSATPAHQMYHQPINMHVDQQPLPPLANSVLSLPALCITPQPTPLHPTSSSVVPINLSVPAVSASPIPAEPPMPPAHPSCSKTKKPPRSNSSEHPEVDDEVQQNLEMIKHLCKVAEANKTETPANPLKKVKRLPSDTPQSVVPVNSMPTMPLVPHSGSHFMPIMGMTMDGHGMYNSPFPGATFVPMYCHMPPIGTTGPPGPAGVPAIPPSKLTTLEMPFNEGTVRGRGRPKGSYKIISQCKITGETNSSNVNVPQFQEDMTKTQTYDPGAVTPSETSEQATEKRQEESGAVELRAGNSSCPPTSMTATPLPQGMFVFNSSPFMFGGSTATGDVTGESAGLNFQPLVSPYSWSHMAGSSMMDMSSNFARVVTPVTSSTMFPVPYTETVVTAPMYPPQSAAMLYTSSGQSVMMSTVPAASNANLMPTEHSATLPSIEMLTSTPLQIHQTITNNPLTGFITCKDISAITPNANFTSIKPVTRLMDPPLLPSASPVSDAGGEETTDFDVTTWKWLPSSMEMPVTVAVRSVDGVLVQLLDFVYLQGPSSKMPFVARIENFIRDTDHGEVRLQIRWCYDKSRLLDMNNASEVSSRDPILSRMLAGLPQDALFLDSRTETAPVSLDCVQRHIFTQQRTVFTARSVDDADLARLDRQRAVMNCFTGNVFVDPLMTACSPTNVFCVLGHYDCVKQRISLSSPFTHK